ncbi:family 43 glycosylhydrolase [uncultured Draconibacterium sp.]|uniref:family 43 glycosylhydrolase n=1 Tax=uncultured Draconibacterium sp. TaxID=1573823 RepID=UPI0029C8E4C3|nr:family 43 glycosylhydrolase [uncultured Draconibacterium sp.]
MKRNLIFLILIIPAFLNAQEYSQSKKDIKKSIEAHDKAVHIFHDWMRDPFITLAPDGTYLLTATQHGETIDGRPCTNWAAPLYKSKNLADWEFAGYYYDISKDAANYKDYLARWGERKKRIKKEEPLKLWAPEIHFINGNWHVLHTSNSGLGNFATTKGEKLESPYKAWNEKFHRQHDPSLFQDDDGSVYLVSRAAQIQKLNKDLTGFDGEPIKIGPSNRKIGHEGAYILKIGEKYVLFGTAWSTDKMRHGTYNLYYCTADKVDGPYGERKFAGRFLGHGTPFKDKQGRWWCTAFYNANKPTLNPYEAPKMDLSDTAYTINKQGLTIVPLEVNIVDGDVVIRAKDEHYRYPGEEEVQKF